jgi:arylsulfatase A-like enzyme
LITVDCLRADHCGWHGYPLSTTPFLDTLARESFVVPTAIVAGSPTYYSIPAILAARMPLALGRDVVGLAPGETTLAGVLRKSGYATGAFSAGNPYISPRFGCDQGFDVFEDFLDEERSDIDVRVSDVTTARSKLNHATKSFANSLGLGKLYNELYFRYCMRKAPATVSIETLRRFPDAGVLVDRAISWLATIDEQPFFLWLHLMDPHSPYYPRSDSHKEFTGKEIDPKRARFLNHYWNRSDLSPSDFLKKKADVVELYDAGIRAADSQIARLVSNMKQTKRWENCVFALTADHGEEFLEHGGRYHAPVCLSEEIIHVPLLIRVPGEQGREAPGVPMSLLHLVPTLLDIVDLGSIASFKGRSQWTKLNSNVDADQAIDNQAITECVFGCTNPFKRENRNSQRLLSIRESRFKLTMRLENGVREQIYDLETDPEESKANSDRITRDVRERLLQAVHRQLTKISTCEDSDLCFRAHLRDMQYEISD